MANKNGPNVRVRSVYSRDSGRTDLDAHVAHARRALPPSVGRASIAGVKMTKGRLHARWCFAFLVVVLARSAHAQVNAETLGELVTKPGWGGGGKSTLAFSSGNVDLLEVRGELSSYYATSHPDAPPDAERFWFRHRVLAYGSAGYKRVSDIGVANDGYGHLRYTHMPWLRVGGEVFGQAQYDKFRLLQRRLLFGLGGRFVFANYERFRAWVGSGTLVEVERRNIKPENQPPAGPDPVEMTNWRWSTYVTLLIPIVSEHLSLITTAYVQPRWDAFRDVQILDEARFQLKVTAHLSITTDLSVRFDSRPPRTVERTDVRVGNGLIYSY